MERCRVLGQEKLLMFRAGKARLLALRGELARRIENRRNIPGAELTPEFRQLVELLEETRLTLDEFNREEEEALVVVDVCDFILSR